MEEEKPAQQKQPEQMIPEKEGNCHEEDNTPNETPSKQSVVVQPMPEEQKKKVQLGTLGVQPFVFQPQDEQANFVSCRLGDIIKEGLHSNNLKYLYVRNNLIQVIQGLQGFPNLIELELYDNKILKIENLEAFTNLEVLDLSYNNIKVIENVSHLKKLKKLFLLSNKIKKIQNLDFPALEMLELGSNKIKEIQNLEGVASIKALYLGKNRIKTIKNLEPLVNLQQIALGPNGLTQINEGLLPLKAKLRELYLQENQISRINNVNQLKKLQILDISYNKIEHLENIDQLSMLQCLYLNGNKIDEYQQLLNLKHNSKLNTISLFGNDVTKEPGYRMKLVEILPEIDDIDGTPMKTSYKIVFGSKKDTEEGPANNDK